MDFGLSSILSIIWTATAVPLIVKGFAWLGRQINRTKLAEQSQIDEQIMKALEIGVSNVGSALVDKMRADLADGKISSPEWAATCQKAKAEALGQAAVLLDGAARDALAGKSDAALDALIRYIVDRRERIR